MSETNEKNCILANVCKLAGKAQCKRSCASFISLHGASAIGGRIGAAHVPEDYRLLTVANMPTRETDIYVSLDGTTDAQKSAKLGRTIDGYIKTFERQFDVIERSEERIKGLYLHSRNTGTGKTTTAAAILHSWIVAHYIGSLKRGQQAIGRPAYFVSVNNLQQLHNKAHSPASASVKERLGDELLREIELAKKTPFVVLDDLAVRKATTSFLGVLYDIADYRTSNRMPTIVTSNKNMPELKAFFYDEDPEGKVVDRLFDLSLAIKFSGESHRGMRKEGRNV